MSEEHGESPVNAVNVDLTKITNAAQSAADAISALEKVMSPGHNTKGSGEALHSDPITGWAQATQNTDAIDAIPVPSLSDPSLTHQTLVIIEASAGSPRLFKDRMMRFVGGLNTESTMKANVITVADGKMYAGLTFEGKKSGGLDVKINPGRWNAVIRIYDKDVM